VSRNYSQKEREFSVRLGGWLKQLRINRELSQTELAESIGTHRNTVARYEAGGVMPLYVFLRINEKIGVAAQEVLKW
jgi:transcriptional regulator with XRE-family HTH domain